MDESKPKNKLLPLAETEEDIADRIFTIRGVQVMLDSDIAALFQVDVKRLNEQRKRSQGRFPMDFCFRITKEERDCLRSQIAAFTEYRSQSCFKSIEHRSFCCGDMAARRGTDTLRFKERIIIRYLAF